MQRSFVELVRGGTLAMVEAAVKANPSAVNTPVVHANESIYPIVEAVKRGDAAILQCLISAGAQLNVQASERTGGCGMESTTSTSPLAEALVDRRADLAQIIIEADSDLAHDPGYLVVSTFEGNISKSVLDLANELGNTTIINAIKQKLSA